MSSAAFEQLTAGHEPLVERSFPDDKFVHFRFTETTHPELARAAWIMHAYGYYAAGFVEASAIGEDGLPPEMDKARGPNVDYYLALDKDPGKYGQGATWRIESIPEGGTYKDLPAYGLTRHVMSPKGEAYLEAVAANYDLKEIGAMARTVVDPMALYEVIRHGMYDAQDKNQAWLFSVVSDTLHKGLMPRFGVDNFVILGGETAIDDDKVKGDKVRLVPAILYPDQMIEHIYTSMQKVPTGVAQKRLRDNMRFLSRALQPGRVPEYVAAELQRSAVGSAATEILTNQLLAEA